jgi:hypothetical protein
MRKDIARQSSCIATSIRGVNVSFSVSSANFAIMMLDALIVFAE